MRAPTVIFATVLGLLAIPQFTRAANLLIYPIGPLNPRVPNILPESGDSPARRLPFDTQFKYSLAPAVRFPDGGHLSLRLRDNLSRAAKDVLVLAEGSRTVTLQVLPASERRRLQLVVADGARAEGVATMLRPDEGHWSQLDVQWDQNGLTLSQDGKIAGLLPLSKPFSPLELAIRTWHVSDLSLSGDGEFSLDWGDGYAARVTPGSAAGELVARLFGFDTYVISLDPGKRDFPIVQIVNTDSVERIVELSFTLSSEVNGWNRQWKQTVSVPAGSQAFAPVEFPQKLESDVYHLTIESNPAVLKERRHFLYVQRREEPAGPPKFGLHDSDTSAFGYWPDALPIHFEHVYARWGYIQGPAWIKDFNGDWGIDPQLPPEEWNWNPRLEWAVRDGHAPYVCVQSSPFLPWMRSKLYPKANMTQQPWGFVGGAPNDAAYRKFVRALAERYRGKVSAYEVENEPNTSLGFPPEDYIAIARDVYEEVKTTDPLARVFGICGTSRFVDWMRDVFQRGGADCMDGVSWHTYVSPGLPEDVNLAGLLADARRVIEATGRKLAIVNSETGTYVALREEVSQPISDQRLELLIEQGVTPLAVPTGFPTRAVSERSGGSSVVENAVTNFVAGAECFTFFGWNPDWPANPKWWNTRGEECFAAISASKTGERTPSLFTLALGVLTAQMEPALPLHAAAISGEYGLRGAVFDKQGHGKLAVLWSATGRRTALLESSDPVLDVVTLLGSSTTSHGTKAGEGKFVHRLEVGTEPTYVHCQGGELAVMRSAIRSVVVEPSPGGRTRISLTVQNSFGRTWDGSIAIEEDARWSISPREQKFAIEADRETTISFDLKIAAGVRRGRYPLGIRMVLPDGQGCDTSVEVPVLPSFKVSRLPGGTPPAAVRDWQMPGGPLLLNRPEQVMIGRPPAMASLQESMFWGGPNELSAQVKIGSDSGLVVYVEVRDANASVPKNWPGVAGSCVEFFFDCRPPGRGLGSSRYDRDVHQIIVRPIVEEGQEVGVWKASSGSIDLPGKVVESGRLSAGSYWVALRLPWRDLGVDVGAGRTIGFDVGIDGAQAGGGGRKSQIMLFGSASNATDASQFGVGFVEP